MRTHFWIPFAFVLPALAVFACFVLVPIVGSLAMSFFDWTRSGGASYVGLEQFRRVWSDIVFWRAALNNAAILVATLLFQLPVAALLAILLSYRTVGQSWFRTGFFAPMVMPTIAIAILWMNIYSPGDGIATHVCKLLFGDGFQYHWLSTGASSAWLPAPSLCWIFVTICWQYIGFHTVLFMAGIAGIPEDYFEAARLDGAGEFQIVRYIVLPLLSPTIAVSSTLAIIGSLKYFDLIYLMGGAMSEQDREVIATYIYRLAFEQGQGRFGQGSAAAVTLFALALAIVIPLQRRRLRGGGEDAR